MPWVVGVAGLVQHPNQVTLAGGLERNVQVDPDVVM